MDRFWSKVDKTSTLVLAHVSTPCWYWIAGKSKSTGYGCFKVSRERGKKDSHRFAYELQYGEIPSGLCVCHHCDNRLCVRGDHLFLGTLKDNAYDMISKGRNRTNFNPVSKGKPSPFRKTAKEGNAWCYKCANFLRVDLFCRELKRWNGLQKVCRECKRKLRKKL